MARRTGSRPSTMRLKLERAAGILVVGLEVEPAIKARHLLSITVEHQGWPALHEQPAFADPPFRRLAPARVIDVGIDVGVKTIFAGVLQVPGARRLLVGEADPHD